MADSVTRWLYGVKAGDAAAMAPLWDRYSDVIRAIASRLFAGGRLRMADADEVVSDTFQRLWRAAQQNQLDELNDRQALARLLSKIASQRAVDLLRSERCVVRGGGNVRGDSVFGGHGESGGVGFASVADDTLPPDLQLMAEEETRQLLRLLGDDELASIAVAKMDGYTNQEIGELLQCSLSTIERSLRLIRKKWERVLADEQPC